MKYGVFLPIFNALADPTILSQLAQEAEAAGWDGVFFWDHIYYRPPVSEVTDPWIAMAVTAATTSRITFGPMVTPLARRRPAVVARQAVALDQLSGGRFVLGAGLGLDASGSELSRFGEETDDRRRATMLDEALDLLRALLSGEVVDHHGDHYTAADVRFTPTPVRDRLPIWIAGRWPYTRPLKRAARHDGLFLIDIDDPADLARAAETVRANRPTGDLTGYQIAVTRDPGTDPAPWAEAGATWWLTWLDPFTLNIDDVRRVIDAGRPR